MVGCLACLGKVGIPGLWRLGWVARACLENALGSYAPDLSRSLVLLSLTILMSGLMVAVLLMTLQRFRSLEWGFL